MEFGLSFLPDANNNSLPAAEYYQNALILSQFAEDIGFKTIKMTEHYLHDYGGYCPSPLIFLASVAAVTKNIRLMTGCILPAFHHPLQIASATAQLDAISGGRLDIGFARAYLPYEFSAFGIDMDTSRERFEQTIAAVMALWTNNNVSLKSDFFEFIDANSLPIPIQHPHPPVWGAAVTARQSFAWFGEHGFNLLVTPPLTELADLVDKLAIYRDSFIPNVVNRLPTIAISLPLLIRDTQEEAEHDGDRYLSEYTRVWADAVDSWNNKTSNNYPGYTGLSQLLRLNTPNEMRRTMQALIGTPANIVKQIRQLIKITQVDQILWQIDFGSQPLNSSLNTLKLFSSEVLPLIKGFKCYEAA